MTGGEVNLQDQITAYQLMIENLPRERDFARAIEERSDGSSSKGVFSAVDRVKQEFYARVGDLRSQLENEHANG